MTWTYQDEPWRMHDRMHGWGGGSGWSGAEWVMVVLLLVVAVAAAVALLLLLRAQSEHRAAVPARTPDARGILQDRLARGEIDEQDFRARMKALEESIGRSG